MSTIHQAGSKKNGKKKKKRLQALKCLRKSPQKKGIIFKNRIMAPKKPNSAKRRVVRVELSTNFMVTAKLKGQGIFLQRYANVMVCGGRANDLPGVRYNMIKGKYDFTWKEKIFRVHARSKYGLKYEDWNWVLTEKIRKQEEEEHGFYKE